MTAFGLTARGALALLSLTMAAGCQSVATEPASPTQAARPGTGERQVAFESLDVAKYASFVKNWNDAREPLFLASIRSAAEWDAVFAPAPLMGGKNNFAPDPALYDKHQLLVASRIVPRLQMQDTFAVESVTENGGHLTVRYRFNPPTPPTSAMFKATLGIVIPRAAYVDATFVENGRQVGVLLLNADPSAPVAQ